MIFGAVSNTQHAILLSSKDANNVRALLNNVNVAFMSLVALYFAVVRTVRYILVYYAVINAHIAVRGYFRPYLQTFKARSTRVSRTSS